jgi:hypothetical protein
MYCKYGSWAAKITYFLTVITIYIRMYVGTYTNSCDHRTVFLSTSDLPKAKMSTKVKIHYCNHIT